MVMIGGKIRVWYSGGKEEWLKGNKKKNEAVVFRIRSRSSWALENRGSAACDAA